MLNYLLFIQSLLFFLVFFIFWITDFIILLLFGIFYLLIISFLTIVYDSDILISFLIIIDLGVFFILLSFSIHFLKFIDYKYIFINQIKNILILFIIIFILIINIFNLSSQHININFIFSWFFFINFINYYYINTLIFYSDMHIFKEIYFNINSLEFILISILLIVAIVVVYNLSNFIIKWTINSSFSNFKLNNINLKKNNSYYFFKIQFNNNQYNIPASCRVFNKLKYDSKINNTINNR